MASRSPTRPVQQWRTAFCAPAALAPVTPQRAAAAPRRAAKAPVPRLSKRTRAPMPLRMTAGEIDGGELPESNEPTPEVLYFTGSSATPEGPTSTPDFLPSSLLDEGENVSEIPLFPLRLVLNPGSNVPLHIFESRYRLMFNRLREEGGDGKFGIVLFNSQQQQQQQLLKSEREEQEKQKEAGTAKNNPATLALIGCTAEVTRFDPLPDGRIMTNNIGRSRFKILRIVEEKPYIRAKVEKLRDETPTVNLLPLINSVWTALQDVLRLSNKLYDKGLTLSAELQALSPGDDADSLGGLKPTKDETNVPDGWPSPSLSEEFSFIICQVLDMPLKEQQILLQITETADRLKRQFNMLSTARNYLAAQVTIKEAGLKGF